MRFGAKSNFGGTAAARRGFTLIELLLVVTLMMLLVATVTTNIDLMLPSTRLEATARQLSSNIELARTSAIAQGVSYRLEYNLTKSGYRVSTPFKAGGGLAANDTERIPTEWRYFPEGITIERIILGSTIIERLRDGMDATTSNDRVQSIEVRPNGNTIEHTICLNRDQPPGKFYLSVQGLTGFVQLYGEDWRPDMVTESDFK